MGKTKRKFDLAERTALLAESTIRIARQIRQDAITKPLISQLIRASGSIGANYAEADEAGTKKEFRYRISLCRRECKETKHWLRLLAVAVDETATDDLRLIWKEADELIKIFAKIQKNSKPADREKT